MIKKVRQEDQLTRFASKGITPRKLKPANLLLMRQALLTSEASEDKNKNTSGMYRFKGRNSIEESNTLDASLA